MYSAIKLPQMKQVRECCSFIETLVSQSTDVFMLSKFFLLQTRQSPKQHKTGNMDTGAATSTLNYVTLDFKGQNEPEKR